ncbi:alpha/beta hydrolase [uncultured Maribacter sp.]|uniref:alpha/beta fold hydrolase n=1 Tax=uncultured Maribacter sp. TaxID=431308 RepID=UPI002606864C|nr:alpha/beta hydrolase [uncultured Maribacter sp.]
MQLKNIIFFFILLITNTSFAQNKIAEEKFITIGGIEQWVTIKGDDSDNPIILIIHGGPGSTMSHYKEDVYADWLKEFTIVHWDQRGAGKTFGKNCPKDINDEFYLNNPLTVNEMVNDGILVTQYLLKQFNKKKVILIGTSWGSILATEMAQKNPDLYHAYIGHAQFVNFLANVKNAYLEVKKLADQNNDKVIMDRLNNLGAPPYIKAKTYGQLLRIIKQYERENATPAPSSWGKVAASYENNEDSRDRYNGDDYSFLNLVGDENIGVKSMVSNINLEHTAIVFRLPVFMIQGKHDILCSTELNKPYFEKIRAPRKEYFTVSNAAHGFNEAIIDKQYEIVKTLRVQN